MGDDQSQSVQLSQDELDKIVKMAHGIVSVTENGKVIIDQKTGVQLRALGDNKVIILNYNAIYYDEKSNVVNDVDKPYREISRRPHQGISEKIEVGTGEPTLDISSSLIEHCDSNNLYNRMLEESQKVGGIKQLFKKLVKFAVHKYVNRNQACKALGITWAGLSYQLKGMNKED